MTQILYFSTMIKEVRAFYGISQDLLADYLGISRSHLSMAEGGRRALPTAATLKLLKFYQAMQEAATAAAAAPLKAPKASMQQKKKLSREALALCQEKILLQQRWIKKLQEQQNRAEKVLASVNSLAGSADEFDAGMLEIISIQARKMQARSSTDQLLKLDFELTLLLATQQQLENTIKKPEAKRR